MRTRPSDEIFRLGREIYLQNILPLVEADHFGEYVLIDVDTGDWAMAGSTLVARQLLREKRPEAVDVWCECVGYKVATSLGGGVRLGRPEMPEKTTKGDRND